MIVDRTRCGHAIESAVTFGQCGRVLGAIDRDHVRVLLAAVREAGSPPSG